MPTKPKILLVYPNIWSDVFPLSILILSSVLKTQGFEVDVFSAVHRRRVNSPPNTVVTEGPDPDVFDEFRQHIKSFEPDVVALSVVEDAFTLATQLLDEIPDFAGFVIMGGVFPTFAPETAIAHSRVNAICIGEGENALVQLCSRMQHDKSAYDIPGLWIKRHNGSIQKNPAGARVAIDELPAPDYSILDRQKFSGPVPLIAHRGCPYPCTFCNSPAQARIFDSRSQTPFFRKHSMAALRRDLEILTTQHATKINREGLYFCSDTLLAWTPYEFDEFIEMYSDFKLPFICHSTPETITADKMNKLVAVGLKMMNIGIQHGNEIFRRDVLKRKMPNAELIKRFDIASDSGAWISADFIMGFPTETPELAWDTLRVSRTIRSTVKNCSIFVPYHGTELRALAISLGYLSPEVLARWSPELSQLDMPAFPKAEIARLMQLFKSKHVFDEPSFAMYQRPAGGHELVIHE